MYSQIDANKRKTVVLIIVFTILVLILGWFFGQIYQTGYLGIVIALIISVLMSLSGYYKGDQIALAAAGAKEINKEENPYVYRMVENLAITAGLPTPKVYIIDDNAINAFATGRDPEHASIAITKGAIKKLENEELEGVIGHELSHIKNYDIRLMTIVIVLVGTISLIADIALHTRTRRNEKLSGIIFLIGIFFIILSPFIAQLIKLAISRKREFLADADSALLTRYPEGLARALEKIAMDDIKMERANTAIAHLYIASPFGTKKKFFAKMFSTHPPIEERIKALRNMIGS